MELDVFTNQAFVCHILVFQRYRIDLNYHCRLTTVVYNHVPLCAVKLESIVIQSKVWNLTLIVLKQIPAPNKQMLCKINLINTSTLWFHCTELDKCCVTDFLWYYVIVNNVLADYVLKPIYSTTRTCESICSTIFWKSPVRILHCDIFRIIYKKCDTVKGIESHVEEF